MASENSRPNWHIPTDSFISAVHGGVNDTWMPLLPRTSHLEVLPCCQPSISCRIGSRDVQEQARILGVSVSLGCGAGELKQFHKPFQTQIVPINQGKEPTAAQEKQECMKAAAWICWVPGGPMMSWWGTATLQFTPWQSPGSGSLP